MADSKTRRPRPAIAPRKETVEAKGRRARKIVAGLRTLYPDATCALHHDSALQLLLATILSAQSTDETVNKVTPVLFARYPSAGDLAAAPAERVEQIIYPTGFFRQKTRSIIGACKAIVERFGGEVPQRMEELVELPGVARKTANVLLGTWYHQNEGVVVDTHVGRLAHRLGLTWTSKDEKDAVKIEQDLMQVLPRKEWTFTSHALIWHGRRVCAARKPRCGECGLNRLCPAAFTFEPSGEGKPAGKTKPRNESPAGRGKK
jgi:endonuclease-3